MSTTHDISREDRQDSGIRPVRMTWLVLAGVWMLTAALPLLAEAGKTKSKDVSAKPTAAATIKADAATISSASASTDPVVCVKPGDADSAQASATDQKSGNVASAKASAGDTEVSDSADSNKDFMKDKLKLSLGGKSASASDQPQQCGIDEADSQEKK